MNKQPVRSNQPSKINQPIKINQSDKNKQLVPSNSHEMKNKENDEKIEEIKITKDKNNKGPRALVPQNKINKEIELQNRIINLQNQVIESDPIGRMEILEAFHESKRKFLEIPRIKMFYNNDFHKDKLETIDGYECLLNDLLAPLEWLTVSYVKDQFLSVHHIAGTEIIMKFFMPYYDYDIDVQRNKNDEITITKLTIINKMFPFYKTRHVSAPGNNKSNISIGGEQGKLTYAMKFATSFGFLRTIGFNVTKMNLEYLKIGS